MMLAAASADEPFRGTEVQLVDVRRGTGLGCYGQCGDMTVEIRVENIAYHKDVDLVYSIGGGSWYVRNARYKRPDPDHPGYELWEAYLPYIYPKSSPVQFALHYRVDGKEYWDNNGGRDYIY